MGVGVNFDRVGVAATAGLKKGKLGVDVTGGSTWQKNWYAGVRATWRF